MVDVGVITGGKPEGDKEVPKYGTSMQKNARGTVETLCRTVELELKLDDDPTRRNRRLSLYSFKACAQHREVLS